MDFQAQLVHPLETVTSFLSHDAFSVSSLRSWTIHLLNGNNQTELTEPPPLSRSNVPANPVSLPPYRSNIIILFDAMPVFLVIFISQSVQSPLRNINSPFGFHGAVNLSSDSNKRFVYDVGAYNSDDDKADQNGMGVFLNEMAAMMNLCIVGTLIGKGGEIVRNLQLSSEADLNSALRPVEIIGNLASIEKAEKLINEVIAQTIKNMQTKSRARIQVTGYADG
ncbi:hypothetical protein HID58_012263 [Brassica napus]|uniref:K Homology domain-containing protein n=1 Tax=Brassica napus TaxID=3708 RepID=A0ABQ8E0J2_BRANA|nr:hypothetical protein HID58_012263 [Brassica napus]